MLLSSSSNVAGESNDNVRSDCVVMSCWRWCPCISGGEFHGETVTDGSGGVGDGGGVGIIVGAAQMFVSTPVDESESGLGAAAEHCGKYIYIYNINIYYYT